MKIVKRVLQIIIVLVISILMVVPVQAGSTTTGNATYNETQKLDKMDVGYGVSYYRSVGKTSTTIRSGTYNQTVHYLNTVSNETIRVVPWTKFVNNKWKLTTVRNLMADFEEKNPGWIVLAGVNADFFDIIALNPLPINRIMVKYLKETFIKLVEKAIIVRLELLMMVRLIL